jgi:hypothetical protein
MLDLLIVIIEVIYQLLFAPLWFPNSGPGTIFGLQDFPIWSTRQKNLLKNQYFKQIFDKKLIIKLHISISWSVELVYKILWSANILFNVLWSASVWETVLYPKVITLCCFR